MQRLLRPLGYNLALTFVSVIVCLNLFYLVSLIMNDSANPSAMRFLKQGGGVDTPVLERYYWIRNFCLIVGSMVGLVGAQVVWILDHLGKSRSAS